MHSNTRMMIMIHVQSGAGPMVVSMHGLCCSYCLGIWERSLSCLPSSCVSDRKKMLHPNLQTVDLRRSALTATFLTVWMKRGTQEIILTKLRQAHWDFILCSLPIRTSGSRAGGEVTSSCRRVMCPVPYLNSLLVLGYLFIYFILFFVLTVHGHWMFSCFSCYLTKNLLIGEEQIGWLQFVNQIVPYLSIACKNWLLSEQEGTRS